MALAGSIDGAVRYRPILYLTIDGVTPPQDFMNSILQIVVEESLHLPGLFTIALEDPYKPGYESEDFPIIEKYYDNFLKVGKEVAVGFANVITDEATFNQDYVEPRLLVGEITAIEVPFSKRAQSPIIIRGYDYSHRLHRGRWNRSFLGETDSSIALKLAREAGIGVGQVDDSGIVHEYVFQENQTNMEFLKERAARIGFEMFVKDGLLFFRKPIPEEIPPPLDWLNYSLDNIRVRVNSIEQIKEVQVRGWNYPEKKPFIANAAAQSGSVITELPDHGDGLSISGVFGGKPAEQVFYVVDQPVYQQVEADFLAQACCDEIRGQYIHADIEAEGDPRLRPGRSVNLNIPELHRFQGTYYITETRHLYEPDRERTYNTEFVVRGLRNSNLLTTIAPPNRLQPGQTFLIGIVTENEDPDNMARIKVKFPTLTEEHNSHWARIVSIGAGNDRGIDWLPEIDDEVIVAFEHGDIHRPLIIGSVWNGVDEPPENIKDSVVDNKVRLRTLRTRIGHQIQFIDDKKGTSEVGIRIDTQLDGDNPDERKHHMYFNDDSKYINIDTAEGHHIHLQDPNGSEQYIDIKTKGGHSIRLEDSPGEYIELKTNGGHIIRMDDKDKTLTISSSGDLNIQAPGIISIQGEIIKLN